MVGIVKRFPGVLAVDGVDFTVERGEIHALLGENGAGKSTLMQVLSGRLMPEEGWVSLFGQRLNPGEPKAAIEAGLGMVYQKFMLVPSLSVAENLLLGRQSGLGLDTAAISAAITDLGKRFGLEVDPSAKIWQLSVGERQRVEILRLLLFEARVLILDEPTAILTPQEAEELFKALIQLRDQDRSVVFISHKMDEVMALADRVTVLSRGRKKVTVDADQTDKHALARLMVEGDWEPGAGTAKTACATGEERPVVKLENVTVSGDLGLTSLDGLDLQVRAGEVLGIAGVAGNGQKELAEVCCGVRRPESGRVLIDDREMTGRGPADFIKAGVGFIPEDRHGAGCVDILSLVENLMLKDYREERFRRGIWLNWNEARKRAGELLEAYDVRPPNPDAAAGALSGGNLQKLLLARELAREPKLVVAAYPLRGLDLASAGFVRSVLTNHARSGGAVLFIGEDLEALLEVSDRLVVLFRGKVMADLPNDGLSPERLGLYMAGEKAA